MQKKLIPALLLSVLLTSASLHATRIYIKANATGNNDGTSWINAFTSLQSGIGASIPGDTIWVAQGVYKPTTTTTRTISFALPDAVKLFGGFNGTETNLSQRNYTTNVTVLSGDIGVSGNNTDNSYHVVTTAAVSNATVLDGFKIVSGNESNTSGYGGGLYNSSGGSPIIRNCTFQANSAYSGGAIAQYLTGNMLVKDCIIINNTATGFSTGAGGGAFVSVGGTVTFTGCVMQSNSGYNGGAIHLREGLTKIDRCDISGNTASSTSGAIYGYSTDFTLQITNTLIVGNSATTTRSAMYCASSPNRQHLLINCTIADNLAGNNTTSSVYLNTGSDAYNTIFNGNSEPTQSSGISTANCTGSLTNPQFVSRGGSSIAPFVSSGYNYRLSVLSPLVNLGNAAWLIPAYNADLDSNARTHGPAPDIGCYENPYCNYNLSIVSTDSTAICPGSSTVLNASAGTAFLWSDNSTGSSITVNTAGTYTLMADSAGCLGNASYQVSIQTVSAAINGVSSICPGDSGLIIASGPNAGSFLWNNNSTNDSLYVSSAGTYSVTLTTLSGCTATASTTITALPAPNPTVSFSSPVISTGSFASYQWLLNGVPINGANSQQYTVTQNGNYSVIVTNSSGCSDTSAIYTILNLGIVPVIQNEFALSPNPNNGTFTLQLNTNEIADVLIYDAVGKLVSASKVQPNMQQQISIETAGVYLVTVVTADGNRSSQRVVVRN